MYKMFTYSEAKEAELPGLGRWCEDWGCFIYDMSTDPPTLIASDRMEPEDANFYRDLAWIVPLLNKERTGHVQS